MADEATTTNRKPTSGWGKKELTQYRVTYREVKHLFSEEGLELDADCLLASAEWGDGLDEKVNDRKVGRLTMKEIYDCENAWEAMTDSQFGLVSRVQSVVEENNEARVDDLADYLLYSLSFTSRPREVNIAEVVAKTSAFDFYRQYQIKNGDISSIFDFVGIAFGQYGLIAEPVITFVMENKKSGSVGDALKNPYRGQVFGELLNAALYNYRQHRQHLPKDETPPDRYPMINASMFKTKLVLNYVVFSADYLRCVDEGVEVDIEVVIHQHGTISLLDVHGNSSQRQQFFQAWSWLKTWVKKQAGYFDLS